MSPARLGGWGLRRWADLQSAPTSVVEIDDERLIAAVARGDSSAFRAVVERHAPAIHRLAYRMLGDAGDAEDVVQESLVRLWDHAGEWRSTGGGVPGWLRRVATNLCLDRIRRSARVSDTALPDRADPAAPADTKLDAERLGLVVQRVVLELPERQRAAVVLTYYEELSNAAAAELLAMSVKGFESLLFRGRASLRAMLGEAGVSAADLEAQS